MAVVPALPPPTVAQVVENIGGPQQGQQQTIGHPQAGQMNQTATIQQTPVVTMSTITLAVPPPAMSLACPPSQGTSMSMAQAQQTTQLQQSIIASSIALTGPIQQNSPLTTSMSMAGPIQQTNLPSSISMADLLPLSPKFLENPHAVLHVTMMSQKYSWMSVID